MMREQNPVRILHVEDNPRAIQITQLYLEAKNNNFETRIERQRRKGKGVLMMEEGHTSGIKLKNKLLILLFTIVVCVALAFYVGFIKSEAIVYTHFFYIPIILAGMWYHRKAVYIALGLGMVHILVTHFSPLPISINEFERAAIFIAVASVIGFISEKRAKAEEKVQVSEKQIRETKEYLDNVIDSSVDAITVVDMNGIVRDWNKGAEGIMVYRADETIGTSNRKFFADPEEADRIMECVQREGEIKNYRTIVVRNKL